MTLGNRLYEMRKEKGLSQEQVAEILGVTRQTVSKWETDQTTPDFDKIIPLCNLYNVSTDELLTGNKQGDYTIDYNATEKPDYEIQQDTEYIARYNKHKTRFAILMSAAIFLYIVSVIPFFIFDNDTVMLSVFFIIIAIATMLIVFGAVSKPKAPKFNEIVTKEQKLYKQISKILSSVVLIIYMLISFLTGAWHITWLIWVIYAIICQIIRLIFALKGAEVNDEE